MTSTPSNKLIDQVPSQRVIYVFQQFDPSDGEAYVEPTELLRTAWGRRWWIAGFTSLMTALAVAYSLLATEWFRAETTVTLREGSPGAGLAAQLSQLGGLAGLAGISLGSAAEQQPVGILRSRGFARRFIEKNGLLGVLSETSPGSNTEGMGGADGAPDIRLVVDGFMRSVMAVQDDKKTGLIKISVEWKDPELAADWANQLVRQLNDEMRAQALAESQRNILYLSEQLQQTQTVSLQAPIARLLETEMQKLMLAKGAEDFSLRVIDAAEPPALRSKPKRRIIVILAFLGALIFSTMLAATYESLWRSLRRAIAA